MLPPLLSLLLDCAKQPEQSVVSLALGALVHLIEVGGHQFSEDDWDTLLKSIRDASYTTQPLELLNALGFENPSHDELNIVDGTSLKSSSQHEAKNHHLDVGDHGKVSPVPSPRVAEIITRSHNEESGLQITSDESAEGIPSPSTRATRAAEAGSLQRSQTIGQRIMGNMMDNIFVRSLTSKSKGRASDASVPSSPIRLPPDTVDPEVKDDEESPLLGIIRGKCITQLLLLGVIDGIQKKYWVKLNAPQKIAIMDILLSLLEFSATYNSYNNLRQRMHHITDERPPLNLLRQELAGTSIYLDILLKATSGFNTIEAGQEKIVANLEVDSESANDDLTSTQDSSAVNNVDGIAENRLVSFCEQALREASDLQSSAGEATHMDVHRVLELRSPVIVKVIKGMCFMNSQIFRRHLREFYPLLTKLVCCDQIDVRGALGDLFKIQLKALLP